jgi:tRNA threonylcarbamoyladenosine biosynthesis protein TsaB
MKRLAFETAAYACSVALECDGEVHQRFELAPRRHGELLLPWADTLMAEAGIQRQQVDGIVLSRGPGSFTSLRLGVSAGAAIAFALGIPVFAVSSLQALAWEAAVKHQQRHIWAALDARMGEVYCAAYGFQTMPVADNALNHQPPAMLADEALLTPAQCVSNETPPRVESNQWFGAGNGFANDDLQLATQMGARLQAHDADCWPSARALLALADSVAGIAAEQFSPVYLRERVADKPKSGKS